jgi:hypothetical protein
MTPIQTYNALLAQKVITEFAHRNIQGFYCETKAEALKKVIEMIPRESIISWGGSVTIREIGLLDYLKNGGYNILDPSDRSKGGAEMDKIAHQALNCDYFLMSSNAISASGELVNLDGIGNRTAALIYGPKNVIIIAGINKIEQNLDQAVLRAKNKAAALVILSYSKDNISSFDELLGKAQGIWSQVVITTSSTFKDRIKVILVGETLGY